VIAKSIWFTHEKILTVDTCKSFLRAIGHTNIGQQNVVICSTSTVCSTDNSVLLPYVSLHQGLYKMKHVAQQNTYSLIQYGCLPGTRVGPSRYGAQCKT